MGLRDVLKSIPDEEIVTFHREFGEMDDQFNNLVARGEITKEQADLHSLVREGVTAIRAEARRRLLQGPETHETLSSESEFAPSPKEMERAPGTFIRRRGR